MLATRRRVARDPGIGPTPGVDPGAYRTRLTGCEITLRVVTDTKTD